MRTVLLAADLQPLPNYLLDSFRRAEFAPVDPCGLEFDALFFQTAEQFDEGQGVEKAGFDEVHPLVPRGVVPADFPQESAHVGHGEAGGGGDFVHPGVVRIYHDSRAFLSVFPFSVTGRRSRMRTVFGIM